MKPAVLTASVLGTALILASCSSTADTSSVSSSTSTPTLPSPATSSPVPDPTVTQATAAITGMYTALAQRDTKARDSYIVPSVKPKVTTDVVDSIGASSATVSDVQATPAPELGPGTARFTAVVKFTQDDGDAQVERDWYILENTPTGLKIVDTGQEEVLSAMPADPTPTQTPTEESDSGNGQIQSGMCHFNEGAGGLVPCDSAHCEPGYIFPGAASVCTPASYRPPNYRFHDRLSTLSV